MFERTRSLVALCAFLQMGVSSVCLSSDRSVAESDSMIIRFAERYVADAFGSILRSNAVSCSLSFAMRLREDRASAFWFSLLPADRPWMEAYIDLEVTLADGKPSEVELREISLPCHVEDGGCSFPIMEDSAQSIARTYDLPQGGQPWTLKLKYSHRTGLHYWRITSSEKGDRDRTRGRWLDIDVYTGDILDDSSFTSGDGVIAVTRSTDCK